MNWASWGPTIVSVVTAIFIAGMIYGKIKELDQRLGTTILDVESIKVRIGLGEIELAKLQSWRDGYNAASNRHHEYPGHS